MAPKAAPAKKVVAAAKPVAAPPKIASGSTRRLEIKDEKMAPAAQKIAAVPAAKAPATPAQIAEWAKVGIGPDGTTPLNPQAGAGAAKRKFEIVQTPHGEYRKGTITHRIYEFMNLPADKAMTLEQMRDQLVKEFPGNGVNPDGVMTTVRCQITRQPTERKFDLGRNAAGQYSVHIAGRDNSRVRSPEAQEKLDAKIAAKAEKAKAKLDAREAKVKAKTDAAALKAQAKLDAAKVAADKTVPGGPAVAVVGKLAPVATKKK